MSNGNGIRAKGNFSNQNHDTFDAAKHFIGVRLQQGVPLLDRDWNELEDTRRHFEWTLRKYFIGNGVPKGIDGFKIEATNPASNDLVLRSGRCMVEGYDVANESDVTYSQQGLPALPVPNAPTKYVVYLEIWTEAVTSQEDPDLRNTQDVNLETCIRDQLKWQVKVAPWPLAPGARATYVLAAIDRPTNAAVITASTITDLRRLNLTLADVVDIAADLEPRVETMETALNEIKDALTDINQKLGRLFWDVDMRASDTSAYFGSTVTVTVTVSNYLGPVAGTRVEFSTDYGVVSPASAVTNAEGKATTNLLGVEAARPPEENELPVLNTVASKVALATRSDKTVFYSAMKFEPAEMSVISKYSPPSTFVDVERNLAIILPIPPSKTATVSCYAKEGGGTIVRGIGTVQVLYRQWVRDWVKTKIVDTVREIDVGSRVGNKFGTAWNVEQKELNVNFVKAGIDDIYGDVAAESQGKLIRQLFTDVVSDDDLGKAGVAGQSIAQAVASQVGQKTNQAVKTEINNFTNQGLDKNRAAGYQKTILQSSNQANAGVSQGFKLAFSSGGGFNVGG